MFTYHNAYDTHMNEEGNHNKAVLIIAGALLLALLAAGIYFLFFSNSSVTPIPGSGGTPPIGGGGIIPPGGGNATGTPPATTTPPFVPDLNAPTVTVPTISGGTLAVENFYKKPKELLPHGDVVITETGDYSFLYIAYDQSFLITINNPNIHQARAVAESDIPILLGIPARDVCTLKFSLTVPGDVNLEASGRDYGLSFCPNGIPF